MSGLPPDMLQTLRLFASRFSFRMISLMVSGTRIQCNSFTWALLLFKTHVSPYDMFMQGVKIPDWVAVQRANPPCMAHHGDEYVGCARHVFGRVTEKSLANELLYFPCEMTRTDKACVHDQALLDRPMVTYCKGRGPFGSSLPMRVRLMYTYASDALVLLRGSITPYVHLISCQGSPFYAVDPMPARDDSARLALAVPPL